MSTPTTEEPTSTTATTDDTETGTMTQTTGYSTDYPYYLQVDVATDGQIAQIDEVRSAGVRSLDLSSERH